jgi:hypothetical protein
MDTETTSIIATTALILVLLVIVVFILRIILKRWFPTAGLTKLIGGVHLNIDPKEKLDGKDPVEFIKEIYTNPDGLNVELYERYIGNASARPQITYALKAYLDPNTKRPVLKRDDYDDYYLGSELAKVLYDIGRAMQSDEHIIRESTRTYVREYLSNIPELIEVVETLPRE